MVVVIYILNCKLLWCFKCQGLQVAVDLSKLIGIFEVNFVQENTENIGKAITPSV